MKYVRCDSHCKFPAYDKEEVDNLLKKKANTTDVYTKTEADSKHSELLNKVYIKDDYAVLTGTIAMTSGTGSTTVNYPSGFSYSNSVVISYGQCVSGEKEYSYGYGVRSTNYMNGSLTRHVTLKTSNISLNVYNATSEGSGDKTYSYKLVLMKIS